MDNMEDTTNKLRIQYGNNWKNQVDWRSISVNQKLS
jgi:hypothetical protein